MRKRVLFLVHDLGQGGAEKVLVNLVNNMDLLKFDITVLAVFGGGVNEQFLKPEIRLITPFKKMIRGNSKLMKLFTPGQLHRYLVREHYDIEVSYLEGVSARIISGCKNSQTKLVSWIHVEQHSMQSLAASFRSAKEASNCYNRFDWTVCVSQYVHDDFCSLLNFKRSCTVLHNTMESEKIRSASREQVPDFEDDGAIRLIAVGTLKETKGYDRLLRIMKRLVFEKYRIHLYVLGIGPLQQAMEKYIMENDLENAVTLLGYRINPYKYVAKCDLFVCSSYAEGFSTAAAEALIVGTPVCTVEVAGMKEMLGENNEYGVVTQNDEDKLYCGIRKMIEDPEMLSYYKKKATERGNLFSTERTVKAVEDLFLQV